MTPPKTQPLPISWEECKNRGWEWIDILLVTGDAYIDHPSFGVALIGRYLEHHGYRVAILPQPRYDSAVDFATFPPPRLFCGITAGNLDSIVANYSGNGKVRETDAYSPGGSPWRTKQKDKNNRFRPDRASLIYSNLARSAFGDIPLVLGGIEASLRRFVHFDYKQGKLRSSILTDAKADLLVYGMGEKSILSVAEKCAAGIPLSNIPGTCERLTEKQFTQRFQEDVSKNSEPPLTLPSFDNINKDSSHFLEAEVAIDTFSRNSSDRLLIQKQQSHWVIQHPAPQPLQTKELDLLYSLPYTRRPHPSTPDVPAYRMIRNSVTIVRGCSGNCSFCAITRHQGAAVQSRSNESILKECETIAGMDDFDGTISDLGGPTANLFATRCRIGSCETQDCLYPRLCKNFEIDENRFLELLKDVSSIDAVKHLFISSGMRMEPLLHTPRLLRAIIENHTPGAMKIAPEHSCDEVLRLMHKESHALLKKFINRCRSMRRTKGKEIRFVPYVINSHPGCTAQHTKTLAADMKGLGLTISKFQDFTPTPGTLSTAMFVTGRDIKGNNIFVAKTTGDRLQQRRIIENAFHRKKKTIQQSRRKKNRR